jgi:hypothetical protein
MADDSEQYELPGDEVFAFQKFGTLNTKANRPAIKDEEFAYNLNWFPVGDGNLKTIPDLGAAVYTTPGGTTAINAVAYNIGTTPYMAVFASNGTASQVNLLTNAAISISATSGLFYNGGPTPAAVQWQAKYLVIIASTAAADSYFIWDGSHLYQAGSLSPDTTLTAGGASYTSAPTVTAFGGSGSGATFLAHVANGVVTSVDVTNPGSGYLATDGVVQLAFTGGGSDTSARATAAVATSGGVGDVVITNSGTGYTTSAVVTFSGGGGANAQAVVTGLVNGAITQISVTNPGTGYTSAPTIAVSVGSGFTASVDVRYGQVSSITVSAGGTGYNDNPQVVISAPDSISLPTLQATAVAVTSAGVVTGITVTQAGLGYTKAPTVTIIGGNKAAAGTVNLMPFGIAGTTLETFQGSIWVANGTKVSFTAPGSTSNFATSAGGGSFQATDNFLRSGYVALKQTNGTLYLIGDSSINGISNVLTSVTNGVSTTTFNNTNIDPQTGTAWRDSVVVFGRAIIFANSTGVYALYGGAAEKVSGPLDGLFSTATFNTGAGGGVTPTSAVATMFGIRCYVFMFTFVDPYTNTLSDEMAIWDGTKWFLANQIVDMKIVTTSEINSELTAYGCSTNILWPLFQTPSDLLQKVFQTRLRADPSIIFTKQVNKVYVTALTATGDAPTLTLSIDTERGQGQPFDVTVAGTLTFYGTGGPITFIGTSPITWITSGLVANAQTPNYTAQYGAYIGITGQTFAPEMTLIEVDLLYKGKYSPRV